MWNNKCNAHLLAALLCLAVGTAGAETPADTPSPPAAAPAEAVAPAEAPQPAPAINPLANRPLATLADAQSLARDWVNIAGLRYLAVGRVRPAGGMFIADLVDAATLKTMRNQLVMRRKDGFAVLVYPASLASSREAMAGMAGLEGMAGMAGINARQRPSTHEERVKTLSDARRGVDAWLWYNGLPHLQPGKVTDFGGVYVADLVDARKQVKNQALIRKADGFVVMANPAFVLSDDSRNAHR